MKVYHYADHLKWPQIKNGSWQSDMKPGLGACRRLGFYDHEARRIGAVFALLEPKPEIWISNPYFKNIWGYLTKNIGRLLLEIEIDPLKDGNAFVVDSGHPQGFAYWRQEGIPEKYSHVSILAAERAYISNKIPLGEYLRRKDEFDFALPEVIITEDVPFERISISSDQPLLEESLKDAPEIMDQLDAIPELEQWRLRYREKNPEFDDLCVSGIEKF